MNDYIGAMVVGLVFGWLLHKARLTQYSKIMNVFRFTDLSMLQFMLTAIVVSAIGIYALRDLGLVSLTGSNPTNLVASLVGGLVFGVGMALAGFCPGICAAGGGQGNVDYVIPGFLGFLVGAILFGLTYAKVFPAISGIANLGNVFLPELFHINEWLLIAFLALCALYLFYVLAKLGNLRRDRV